MFTGIIEEVGHVESVQRSGQSGTLTIRAKTVLEDAHIGDSICTNGVCLTVTEIGASTFKADVMHETFERSTLGDLSSGSLVNLERAMPADGRFGGHFVSGHIDGTGTITRIREDSNAVWFTIAAPGRLLAAIVEKGSIAIEGISLTVARVSDHDFSVSVIPHTRAVTNLAFKRIGDEVNLEIDIIGKYVERLLRMEAYLDDPLPPHMKTAGIAEKVRGSGRNTPARGGAGGITEAFLLENGF